MYDLFNCHFVLLGVVLRALFVSLKENHSSDVVDLFKTDIGKEDNRIRNYERT